jgi:hypothetical protein
VAYLLSILAGLISGWVNEHAKDPLLTALCVLGFTMSIGVWKPDRPWRWGLLVWIGVPLVLAYYHFVVKWPHQRWEVYGAFLQLLSANAGSYGGHFMRRMIEGVFGKEGK